MSTRAPPSLQHLALQCQLSNQSQAISALEVLPPVVVISLFMEVYAGGHTEMLKALVQSWPFPCLPLGDLTQSPDLETFKAVLDGLDLVLSKKDSPSQGKLKVLDLQNKDKEMWIQRPHSVAQIASPHILTDRTRVILDPESTKEQPLIITVDLTIKHGSQEDIQSSLLQWARDRKERVQLYSRKLKIQSDCISNILKALDVVRLDSIQDLIVSEFGQHGTMRQFAPFLGQMKNLHVLHISKMGLDFSTSSDMNSCYSSTFGTYLGQLQLLQELHVHGVFFLYGKLPAVFRSLSSLKTLSLSSCVLEEDDLRFLSQCSCTKQLKHLRLRSLLIGSFSPGPLRAVLEQVAGSLQTLALEDCGITDPQLLALLPILSQCSQLSFFTFYGNQISMASLQMLLSHTAQMSHLKRGIYPAPLESYRHKDWFLGNINPERFARVQTVLTQLWRDMGLAQKVQICTKFCHVWNMCQLYRLAPDGCWVFTEENLPDLSALPL
ncbi:PRAME family member 8-like [Thomomys bottae]